MIFSLGHIIVKMEFEKYKYLFLFFLLSKIFDVSF